jgi:hypothetical protein
MAVSKLRRKGAYGNKNAVGSTTNGRPIKYNEEYLEKEAKELDQWSRNESAVNIYSFTYDKDYCASDLAEFGERSPVFKKALNKAKERIAGNRELQCNKQLMNSSVWNRTARIYDSLLTKEEDKTKDEEMLRKMKLMEYEAKLKSENGGASQSDKEKLDAALSLINYLQSQSGTKSSNIDDSKSISD